MWNGESLESRNNSVAPCLKRAFSDRRVVATVLRASTESATDLHLAYTVVKDCLRFLFGGKEGTQQEPCVCQCSATSGECGALERLLSQQLAQKECTPAGSAWHLHLSLGAAFFVVGLVLGLIVSRLGRRTRRTPVAVEAAVELPPLAVDDSPAPGGTPKGCGRGRGRRTIVSG